MTEWNPEANQLFAEAIEIESPDQRNAFLREACGDNADLRAGVERLLRAHNDAGSFLERPANGFAPTIATGEFDTVDDGVSEVSLDFLAASDKPGCVGTLGAYEVIDVVGRGGMGLVLRAHDPKLNRVVAIKVMAPELAANPMAVKRFLREARAAAAVSHDHVVTIHAIEEDNRPPFIVMEFVNGQSVQEKIDCTGGLELLEILRIGMQVARGLAAAHEQGLVHRDIKPANILLENGVERVKITDFGLARAVDDVSVTQTGQIAGTPQFMSPEQAQGHPLDARSDLFSLGSVLYTMCTGRPPFRAETAVAMLRRVTDDDPRSIREVNADIPDWLEAIVFKLLAKEPAERFQSAEKVAELLSQHLAHLQHPTTAPKPTPIVPPIHNIGWASKPAREGLGKPSHASPIWPIVAAGAAISLLLVGLLLAGVIFLIRTPYGTVLVDVTDPKTIVELDGQTVHVRPKPILAGRGQVAAVDEQGEALKIRAGEHQLHVHYGDLSFATQSFTLRRGGTIQVRVELLDGKVSVRADGKIIGSHAVRGQSDRSPQLSTLIRGVLYAVTTGGDLVRLTTGPSGIEQTVLHKLGDGWQNVEGLAMSDDGTLYAAVHGASDDSSLFKINVATGTASRIGPIGFAAVDGLAWRDGNLYGVTSKLGGGAGRLLKINPQTGKGQTLGDPLTLGDLDSLTFDDRGRLLTTDGMGTDDKFYQLDERGEIPPTPLAPTPPIIPKSRDIEGLTLAADGMLYGVTHPNPEGFGQNRSYLVRIDPDTFAYENLGLLDVGTLCLAAGLSSVDGWIDVLSQAVIATDAVSGTWRHEGSSLVLTEGRNGGLMLPVRVHGDYEVRSRFRRIQEGGAVKYWLPIGGGQTAVTLNDWETRHGLDVLDGEPLHDRSRGALVATEGMRIGQTYEMLARVERHGDEVSVAVELDGESLFRWQGAPDRVLSGTGQPPFTAADTIGLGHGLSPGVVWESLELRRLNDAAGRNRITEVRRLKGHTDIVNTLAFSRDGRSVFSGSQKLLFHWDLATGKVIRKIPVESPIKGVCALPDDGHVVTSHFNGEIKLWNMNNGRVVRDFAGHTKKAYSLSVSADGKRLLSGDHDGLVRLWDVDSGDPIHSFQESYCGAVAISGDARFGAHGAGGILMIWNADTGDTMHRIERGPSAVNSLAFSPNGDFLVSGRYYGAVDVWEVATGKPIYHIDAHRDVVTSLCFTPDGRHFLSGSFDKTIRLFELATGREIAHAACDNHCATNLAIAPDGLTLASGGGYWLELKDKAKWQFIQRYDLEFPICLWRLPEIVPSAKKVAQVRLAKRVFTGPQANGITSLAVTPDGKHVFGGGYDGKLYLWEIATGKLVYSLEGHSGLVHAVDVTSDGRFAVSGGEEPATKGKTNRAVPSGKILVWDLQTGEKLHELDSHDARVEVVRFSPDGKLILTVNADFVGKRENSAWLWNAETGELIRKFDIGDEWIVDARFSPDGTRIAAPTQTLRRLLLLDVATGAVIHEFSRNRISADRVDWSPDGRFLVLGHRGTKQIDGKWNDPDNCVLRMIDTESHQTVRTFSGHSGPITAVEFSPDGRWLLSAASGVHDGTGTWVPSIDQSIRLWDVATGEQLVQYESLDRVNTATFTADGRGILSGGRDALRLWAIPDTNASRTINISPLGMKFMSIPAGEFEMGTADEDVDALPPDDEWFFAEFVSDRREAETPRHKVTISKPFEMSEHEVTVGQFRQFIEATGYKTTAEKEGEGYGWRNGEWQDGAAFNWQNPGFEQTDDHPVCNVSWEDATEFCRWLSEQEAVSYRLPTEAEWEYACRAGTTTVFSTGDDPASLQGAANLADAVLRKEQPGVIWAVDWADGFPATAPVGSFRPNAFGLFDMHGNAWEWCQDVYDDEWYETSPAIDPVRLGSGRHVFRGGGFDNWPGFLRSADRYSSHSDSLITDWAGFRVVREVKATRP